MLIAGFFCLGVALLQIGRYQLFQRNIALAALPRVGNPAARPALARLEIPRIGLSVAVLEGDSSKNLALGAAHLKDTAALGSPDGRAAIAGHRDSAFRDLGAVRVGDQIVIHSSQNFAYRVTRTRIVDASDTSALASDGQGRLTLITCYPFNYLGNAPRRFLVEAEIER
jgi:sortase A